MAVAVAAALAASAAAGCGDRPVPGPLVGESAHFRLFIDPAIAPDPALDGDNGLAALETEWSDVASILHMPAGKKIEYHWLSDDHVQAACGDRYESGCTWEDTLEIDAPSLPDAHELNHAYAYLLAQRKPIPFLAEGLAEAIGCSIDHSPTITDVTRPWPAIVASLSSSPDVYEGGTLFVRHLIRAHGADAFMRYYEQSPEERDPALFAANFAAFWGESVDDFWTELHAWTVGDYLIDRKICPCGLPALPTDGALPDDPARAPYWPLPDSGGETLAMSAGPGEFAWIRDCAGAGTEFSGSSELRDKVVLARLAADVPRLVGAPLVSATRDNYVSDTCEDAALFTVPPYFVYGFPTIAVAVNTPTPVSTTMIPWPPPVTVYLKIATPMALKVSGADICLTCAFDQGACQPATAGASITVQGTFYARMKIVPSNPIPTNVIYGEIGFAL
jgi:hypothetical protein